MRINLTGIHNIELKWTVISWNAENCFQAWMFREREFTDPITSFDVSKIKYLLLFIIAIG